MLLPYAPGSRVVIRDEEWLIRRADPSTDGSWLLTCDGVSDIVRGTTALFWSALEDHIKVLDPAKTELVPDPVRPSMRRCFTWKACAAATWRMTRRFTFSAS